MLMELDTDKIKRLKTAAGFTWQEIADKMGLPTRQSVYDYIFNKRLKSADKFAKIFGVDPKDLIK